MNIDALSIFANQVAEYPPTENSPQVAAIEKFAKDNNFTYTMSDSTLVEHNWTDHKLSPAWMGGVGFGSLKDAYHVINGVHSGFEFSMFLLWDHLVDGVVYRNPTKEQQDKFTKQQTTGVVRVSLPKLFPQVVLDSKTNEKLQGSLAVDFRADQSLLLEGDFSKNFRVWAPKGLQVDALVLLAPNMMKLLQKQAGLFDVEFYGNEMVFITKGVLYDPNVMRALDEALTEQLSYISRPLLSWSYVPTDEPFDRLKKSSISGRALKIGRWHITAKHQVIAITLFFLFYIVLIMFLNTK